MKSAKIVTVCMMILVILMPHNCLTGLWKPAGTEAIKTFDELLAKHLPAFANITHEINLASSNIGIEAAKQVAAVGTVGCVIAGVGVTAYSIAQLYPIGKEIASHLCPTEEQKIQQKANLEYAKQRLRLLEAEAEFRECLIKNRINHDRDTYGLPIVCEASAATLANLGKYHEVEQAIYYFNKYGSRTCLKE